MSRLENPAMFRDAVTHVFNLQYALLEKYGLTAVEGVFSWKTDFLMPRKVATITVRMVLMSRSER